MNHDIRMRNSLVCYLQRHYHEVISLNWSVNTSYEQMRQSDPTSVFLSSTSLGSDLAVFRLCDLIYGQSSNKMQPILLDRESFQAPLKAVAWSPSHEGLLATGGGEADKIIRIFDLKCGSYEVQHTIRCNSPITSLSWRKTKLRPSKLEKIEDVSLSFCEELLSSHGDPDFELKLWQINKYQAANIQQQSSLIPNAITSSPLKYWFTKVREWTSH